MSSLVSVTHLARRVAQITFTNSKKLNPMTAALGEALRGAFASLDPAHTSAIVLTGEGSSFSAGGDLDFLRARAAANPEVNVDTMVDFYRLFLTPLRGCPFPVIAAVSGACVGAGAALATAADMRIVSATAKVGFTFTSGVAIHPGMGSTHYLPKAVGPQQAARLLLTGEMVSGRDMAAMGWALEAVEEQQVLPRAIALAERAAAAAPVASRETLATLRAALDQDLEAALKKEAEAQAICYAGKDFLLGLEGVVKKQQPVWSQY
jgi:enoyl-CoA hydratase